MHTNSFHFVALFIDSSCDHFWESNQELQACYQFNLYTILTWSQALSTCQAQGGNLLSITSLAEHRYIRGRHLVENTYSDHKSAKQNIHHAPVTVLPTNSTVELHHTTSDVFFLLDGTQKLYRFCIRTCLDQVLPSRLCTYCSITLFIFYYYLLP